jgi:hypothetical protein
MVREAVARELLDGLEVQESAALIADHRSIVRMLLAGDSIKEILSSPECDRWPETAWWIKYRLRDEP